MGLALRDGTVTIDQDMIADAVSGSCVGEMLQQADVTKIVYDCFETLHGITVSHPLLDLQLVGELRGLPRDSCLEQFRKYIADDDDDDEEEEEQQLKCRASVRRQMGRTIDGLWRKQLGSLLSMYSSAWERLDEEEKQLVAAASILRLNHATSGDYKDKMGHPVVYVVDWEQMGSAELWQN